MSVDNYYECKQPQTERERQAETNILGNANNTSCPPGPSLQGRQPVLLSRAAAVKRKSKEPLRIRHRERGRERRSRELMKGSETGAREASASDPF